MEKLQPTRQQIIEDVRLWSKHFLEVPNLHLGGVPACPFAKKAWMDKKVWVAVKTKHSTYKKELNDCLKNLDFTKKEILIFCDPYFSYSPDELHIATEEYNEWQGTNLDSISSEQEESLKDSMTFRIARKIWYVGRRPASLKDHEWDLITAKMRPKRGTFSRNEKWTNMRFPYTQSYSYESGVTK